MPDASNWTGKIEFKLKKGTEFNGFGVAVKSKKAGRVKISKFAVKFRSAKSDKNLCDHTRKNLVWRKVLMYHLFSI